MIPSPKHKIAELAAAYKGVKFLHQGRDPDVGLDCIGYVRQVVADYGYNCQIPADYPPHPPVSLIQELVVRYLRKIPEASAEIGDIVLVAEGSNRHGRHFAIIADRGNYWVADRSKGVRLRKLARGVIESYYRVPD